MEYLDTASYAGCNDERSFTKSIDAGLQRSAEVNYSCRMTVSHDRDSVVSSQLCGVHAAALSSYHELGINLLLYHEMAFTLWDRPATSCERVCPVRDARFLAPNSGANPERRTGDSKSTTF